MKLNRSVLLVVLFGIIVVSWETTHAELRESAPFPSLISALKIDAPLDLCGEQVPLEVQEVRERLEKELLISLWDRPQVILWLKRSTRYLPIIEEMLRESGMPDDLKYVALAESALRPHAGSRRGAIGFWQFMQYTGRLHGLVINERIDQRRNIFASTQAAVRYFKHLHETFGSWTLAAAAFNMGEEGLMAEILEQGIDNFYQLYLPLETQRYIFRILSAKLILSDPENYGFQLSAGDRYQPIKFDRMQVECAEETPIRIIAQAAKTHFKAIKDLNPEIRGHYLPEGNHAILVPKGASRGFQARYQNLLEHWSADRNERVYRVEKGDNLSTIADRFGIPLSALLIWNRLDPKAHIHPGDTLIIYRKQPKIIENSEDENDVGAASSSRD